MNIAARAEHLQALDEAFDVVVIGGGASGLGAAVEAASRGYKVALFEQADFAKGTSSRSTKLIHGGLRYLGTGYWRLVKRALLERERLTRNAPHLVHELRFVIPRYKWWELPWYGLGLIIYAVMARTKAFAGSGVLDRAETLKRLPSLNPEGLRGGLLYSDGQFDDARLALHLAMTAADLGAVTLNYCPVVGLLHRDERVSGVVVRDAETERAYEVQAKVVLNATGVFADAVRRMDDPAAEAVLLASQGVHVLLPRSFQPGAAALAVPKTPEGKGWFAIPWQDKTLVGTTDTPVDEILLEPEQLESDLEFLFRNANRYLNRPVTRADALATYAGIRPLVGRSRENTAKMSRDHALLVSKKGLVTLVGGKWTTYREMGEDAIDEVIKVGGLPAKDCVSAHLKLHGWTEELRAPEDPLGVYGADAAAVEAIAAEPGWAEPLHPRLPYLRAQVRFAAEEEAARTVEDVLARRVRALFLDVEAAVESAPEVARIMAAVLAKDEDWQRDQVEHFGRLARRYSLSAEQVGGHQHGQQGEQAPREAG